MNTRCLKMEVTISLKEPRTSDGGAETSSSPLVTPFNHIILHDRNCTIWLVYSFVIPSATDFTFRN